MLKCSECIYYVGDKEIDLKMCLFPEGTTPCEIEDNFVSDEDNFIHEGGY